VGGLVTYKLANTFFEGFGLKKTDEEREIEDSIEENFNKGKESWNPAFYLNAKAAGRIIQDLSAIDQERLKNMIYNQCVGYIYDSPSFCITAITTLKYKTQVSVLAHAFENAYGKDLLSFLTDRLDSTGQKKALEEILRHVAYLPNGY
jgi:hypothetical protein